MTGTDSAHTADPARRSQRRRLRLAWALAVLAACSSALILLAGSDLPPPPGFALAILASCGLGLVVRFAVPRLLGECDRNGAARASRLAAISGVVLGVVMGAAFAMLGSGEPGIPAPGPGEIALFLIVVAVVGGLAALAMVLVSALADRASSPKSGYAVVSVAGVVLLLGPIAIIIGRLIN